MKPSIILFTTLLSCLLLLPGMRSIAQVVQPDTAAVDTTGGFRNATFGIRKYAVLQNIRVWDPAVWKSVSVNRHHINRATWFLLK